MSQILELVYEVVTIFIFGVCLVRNFSEKKRKLIFLSSIPCVASLSSQLNSLRVSSDCYNSAFNLIGLSSVLHL